MGPTKILCLGVGHGCSPGTRKDLFLSEAAKSLRVVYYVNITQECENPFLMITQVDVRHENYFVEVIFSPFKSALKGKLILH